MRWRFLVWVGVVLGLAGCGSESSTAPEIHRWYTPEQVRQGEMLFQQHCARCHGERAQGLVADWKQRLPDGSYPPPPLNGTAHAWHHPLPVLRSTIRRGGVPLGGTMPGFGQTLNDTEIDAIIAWFQHFWPDETYQAWAERNR